VGSIMRRSKRITAQPASSSRPADRARENKLKKLGLPLDDAEHMVSKKKQLLLAYKGPQKDLARRTLLRRHSPVSLARRAGPTRFGSPCDYPVVCYLCPYG
jgi:hypothetical protein